MSDTKLKNDDIKKVANLAQIPITENEQATFLPQLESILDYFDVLKKINTDNIQPTYQVTGQTSVLREDEVDEERMLSQQDALKNAKSSYCGFFVTKATIKK